MLTDLRLALRTLRSRPGLVLAVVLCLGLGIGVNSTVYSMVSAVLLRPLPFDDPGRLVAVRQVTEASGRYDDWMPLADFADLRAAGTSFESAAAISIRDVAFATDARNAGAVGLRAAAVTPGWFETLGIRPTLGRTIRGREDATARIVVLGDRVWREQLGADPNVVGRMVRVNGVPHEVVGVMPPDAVLTNDIEQLWIPADPEAPDLSRVASAYRVVGRLRPGATVGAADGEVRAAATRLQAAFPETNAGRGAMAVPLLDALTPPEIRTLMAVMLGAVTLVLLVACANVANLMLGHGVGRAHEMAVRTALGAGRWRIARLLLIESVLLGLAGAAAGAVLAAWGLRATLASFPFQFPAWLQPTVDGRVLAYTMVVGLASGIAFGLLPALRAGRTPPGAVLQDGGRGASVGRARSRVRDVLVGAQLSLSLVLLVAAALMMKSFVLLQRVEPGWVADGVLAVRVSLGDDRFDDDAVRLGALARVRERLAELPGVTAVAAAPQPPTALGGMSVPVSVAGTDVRPEDRPFVDLRAIVGDYHATLRVPIVAGRAPTAAESLDPTARVAVVNDGTARRLWPDGDAVGRRLTLGDSAYTVVGVAADARQRGLAREPGNTAYVAYATRPLARSVTFLLRTGGEPRALADATRDAVTAVDPALAILDVETLATLLDQSLWHERLFGRLFTAFGAAALVLAIVGLYGVVSHATQLRTREIGVRVALGARAADVHRLVLAGSMRVVLASLAIGLLLAAGLVRALASTLYGVSTSDAAVYAGVTLALAAVALVAAWLPARRAARVDPVIALRAD